MSIELTPIGTYETGIFDEGAAEINAYDPGSQRLFVINANAAQIDVLDLSDPSNPVLEGTIDATAVGAGANSVAVKNGLVAVAIESDPSTAPGQVVFFRANADLASLNLAAQTSIEVGSLPDAVTFTPDGTKLLVANEGEPDDGVDPEGSISIIDTTTFVVQTATFTAFNGQEDALRADGVRIFPGIDAATDFEPEFIAVSPDSTTAYAALQEANAIAVIDIATATVTEIQPLGVKDHSLLGNGFDASDDDGVIDIKPQPVVGLYMPDAIATFEANGQTYYVTANEGDDRGDADDAADSPLGDAVRLADLADVETFGRTGLALDASITDAFPNIADDTELGRLTISSIDGDTDGDGDIDVIHSYGARSFTIFDTDGNVVFDSGDDFEQITARLLTSEFNSDNDENGSFDSRSDAKGPEPEGVVIGEVDGKTYAFVGLERIGGIMTYDITDPENATFVNYINNRDFSGDAEAGTAGDLGPEGLTFIAASDSPSGEPLLAVSNEVSGSTTIYSIDNVEPPAGNFVLELLHLTDQEAGARAVDDAPRLSAVLNALREQDLGNDGIEDNTLTLSSGDAFIPGLFYDASEAVFGAKGIADIQIQNELGIQAIALGNHEFDNGTRVLSELITGQDVTDDSNPDDGVVNTVPQSIGTILGSEFKGANFPYLSTNLDFSTDEFLAPLEVEGGQAAQGNVVTSSVIIDVNGENVGVVGATTPTLDRISSPGTVGIRPQPFDTVPTPEQIDALAAEIQAEVDALLAANPDLNKIVLLAHMQQISIEFGLAERLENVDIIVAGGSNTRLLDETDRLRDGDSIQGEYPTFITNSGGTTTAVVNTDGSYKYVGRLVIEFDADGNILPESYDPEVSGAYATDEQGVADLNAAGLVDPEIQQIADAIQDQIISTESNVFGISDVFLNGNRSGTGTADDPDGVRTQETNLGNLTADANLAEAKLEDPTVVVSIKNGGGIRASIGQTLVPPGGTEAVRTPNEEIPGVKPEGGISQNDISTTLAFNNGLTLLTLTKQELVDVLEHGISALPEVAGQFPQIAGVKLSFDPDLPAGDRIQSAGIFDEDDTLVAELVRDGEIIGDVSETFRIVTLSFLADGGDGYPFPTGPAANRVDLAQDGVQTGDATFADDGTEQDALAEFLFDNFFNTPFDEADTGPALDERIQNLNFRDDAIFGDDIVMPPADDAMAIDFEGFASGTVITDQFEGATFSTLSEFGVMIFDSGNVTGGDDDLASDVLGNLLIISEDGDSSDADDAAQGGVITVDFDELTNIEDITLVDIEETGGKITLFGADDVILGMFDITALGDNSVQTLALNTELVSGMEIVLAGSGAIAELSYTA
jgi:2',3'-cyclic-nucleotide 2'-phosphodiesterase (5'-nucleotidase family)